MPPLDSGSAYISMKSLLIVGSTTTQAPPRSSAFGGMYTNTGMSYFVSSSTIFAPNLRTSSYMSLVPPLKPRQFARIMSGSFSPRPKSAIACAVLWAESGYQTWPACGLIDSLESGFAGSAGTTASTVLVSTEITPKGMPPNFARPATTVLPHLLEFP